MELKREEVIKIIYGDGPVQRFTQDSPVLPDVWIAYAQAPDQPRDLLLTPYQNPAKKELTPGQLRNVLNERLNKGRTSARSKAFKRAGKGSHHIAYNQATVVVRLWFDELVRVVLPLSQWWHSHVCRDKAGMRIEDLRLSRKRAQIAKALANPQFDSNLEMPPDVLWTIRVAGTIALANATPEKERQKVWPPPPKDKQYDRQRRLYFRRVVDTLAVLIKDISTEKICDPMVYLVSLNREANITVWRSSAAVKADAAIRLFKVNCSSLTWAIIDSGIDAKHPAFIRRPAGSNPPAKKDAPWASRTRVLATYDFTIIRRLLSTDPEMVAQLPPRIRRKLRKDPALAKNLRYRLNNGRDIDWSLLQDFIEIPHDDVAYQPPVHEHGTHVAGILAADWRAGEGDDDPPEQDVQGICPDINIYDLRVLDNEGKGDEFSVMAAMQFIRHLNAHKEFIVLHGANLSLSIRHDVMNYACGRTPVCEECERLIGAGIVVVAAAGNEGYQRMAAIDTEGYRAISITDPGNAEGVITVGATHRDSPHTFGVSYFSSRGPTGDGRAKPDLVAPGEKIESAIPRGHLKRLDGTSMAAPHVSGVAALLMARHRELVGRPQRIKKILCDTATDLGREKYFQGNGMVDALRALQSV